MIQESVRTARLEDWVKSYGSSILRTCFLYLADRALAEDAMQDTFVKAWCNMEQFTGCNESSAKTWIVRIAINTCIDYQRTPWFRHVDHSTGQPLPDKLPYDTILPEQLEAQIEDLDTNDVVESITLVLQNNEYIAQ